MSTTPTIFDKELPSYTVVGGRERLARTGLSVVLLNRGGAYGRRNLFADFEKAGFDNVISIESSPDHYDVEELAARFPFVRFILLQQEVTLGEQINLAAVELDTPLFFVLWNNLKFVAGGTARRMADRLILAADTGALASPAAPLAAAVSETASPGGSRRYKQLCTVPLILTSRFETIPSLIVPVPAEKKIRTLFLIPRSEGLPSLYPFDGVGIYDRERFIRMGGFDGNLKHAHWQLMDFGFRSYLWGEEIVSTQVIKLSYDGQLPTEDNTTDASYYRFYLKNLAPVFQDGQAHLPLNRFPGYLVHSGDAPVTAWKDFFESRQWVKANCFRWRCDARSIAGRWDALAAAECNDAGCSIAGPA